MRDCTRESTPYAICVRSIGAGNQPLSGPVDVIKVGSKLTASRTAGRSSDLFLRTVDASARAADVCDAHACQIDGDFAHGRIASYGQESRSPRLIAATPSLNWRSARRAGRSPGAAST